MSHGSAHGEGIGASEVVLLNFFRDAFTRNHTFVALRSRVQSLVTAVFAAWLFSIFSPAAGAVQMRRAQPPGHPQATLESLADEIAAAIADLKENPVIVFDFAGPDELTNASEKTLADDFSAAMARMNKEIVTVDRVRIAESLQKKNLALADLEDPHDAQEVAKDLKAKSYVWGAIVLGQDHFDLLVEAFRTQNGKKIAGFAATLPLTDQMKEQAVNRNGKNLPSGLANPGRQGVTYASCAYCPPVQYSQRAVQHHFEGTVLLTVVVSADGSAADVAVLRALPYGLTDKAIETVRSWKFKPAQTSDGTPVAVRQTVEMTFHLY